MTELVSEDNPEVNNISKATSTEAQAQQTKNFNDCLTFRSNMIYEHCISS